MSAPTRFPNGVTNSSPNSNTANFGLPDPSKWHTYFNDWDTYNAAEWTVTEVGTPTQALADEDGGVIVITNSAANDDSSFQQKVGESFLFETGKKLIFKARYKLSDVTQAAMVLGLTLTDGTPVDVSDGVYFRTDDDSGNVALLVAKDSSASIAQFAALEDDTYVTTGFVYDGTNEISIYLNDEKVTTAQFDNIPDDEALTVTFGIENGEAVAKNMSVDYIFAAKER